MEQFEQFYSERELVSTKERKGLYPFSRSNLLLRIADGRFPAPVRISPSRRVWPASVLAEYNRKLAEESRKATEAAQARKAAEQRKDAPGERREAAQAVSAARRRR